MVLLSDCTHKYDFLQRITMNNTLTRSVDLQYVNENNLFSTRMEHIIKKQGMRLRNIFYC